ncbi:hypothetical protein [Altericroceibacterium xinjiangense]|uniref:hypothetical protein n=1 Tax=Altericroceibacterium xinjiangense TaxID=762261 RepID=UPI000F7E2D3C|nr:hypothetical protein [Altericroceibacterium xinjiangense]
MSKQLTLSAVLSVCAMMAFVSVFGTEGATPAWNEAGAATEIAAPIVSAKLPAFPAFFTLQ